MTRVYIFMNVPTSEPLRVYRWEYYISYGNTSSEHTQLELLSIYAER